MREKILVIEDDPKISRLLEIELNLKDLMYFLHTMVKKG